MSLATIFKKHELEATSHLYQPETDSRVTRQLIKIRNEIYLSDDTPILHSIVMELPRYGV